MNNFGIAYCDNEDKEASYGVATKQSCQRTAKERISKQNALLANSVTRHRLQVTL